MMSGEPKLVFLFHGKRKSGKDYVASLLQNLISRDLCDIVTLSAPLKYQYAQDHGLDYQRLLDSTSYKEEHRYKMIKWGESVREKDEGYFCRLATRGMAKPIWLVSDCRRPSDISYFKSQYNAKIVHVVASEKVRESRGWKLVPEIDHAPSECALDDLSCDYQIINDGDSNILLEILERLKEDAIRLLHDS